MKILLALLAKAICSFDRCHPYRGKQGENMTSQVAVADITTEQTTKIINKNINNKIKNNDKTGFQVTKITNEKKLINGTNLDHLCKKTFKIKSKMQGKVTGFTVRAEVVKNHIGMFI